VPDDVARDVRHRVEEAMEVGGVLHWSSRSCQAAEGWKEKGREGGDGLDGSACSWTAGRCMAGWAGRRSAAVTPAGRPPAPHDLPSRATRPAPHGGPPRVRPGGSSCADSQTSCWRGGRCRYAAVPAHLQTMHQHACTGRHAAVTAWQSPANNTATTASSCSVPAGTGH